MKKVFASILEIVEIALTAVAVVFLIRTFLLQPFLVKGASMEPNFSTGDYLLIDELTYKIRPPERGEVIVFKYPGDESTYYIKRIIGLPGERLVLSHDKITVYGNSHSEGSVLEEQYLNYDSMVSGDKEVVLGPSQYFVMGDNRQVSFDSRNWGPLENKEIIGLARLRLWPITKVAAFEKPSYVAP